MKDDADDLILNNASEISETIESYKDRIFKDMNKENIREQCQKVLNDIQIDTKMIQPHHEAEIRK